MKTIRYILTTDAKYIYPHELAKGVESYSINHFENPIIFIDILELTHPNLYKAKVFLRNGEIKTGFILKDCVKLFNGEELFDGRFNS